MTNRIPLLASTIAGLVFLLCCPVAWSQTFDGLTKPESGVWLLDPTGKIDSPASSAINNVCQEISEKFSGQIYVVVIETTGGRNHREYGTQLFNTWGIGSDFKDNGILILAAISDRKAEIILGEGIEMDHDVNHVEVIMDHFLLPNFKRGNFGGGLYEAARGSAARVFGMSDLSAPVDLPETSNAGPGNVGGLPNPNRNNARPANNNFAPNNNALNNNRFQRQPQRRNNLLPWLLGFGGLGGIALFFGGRYYLRYRTRICDECGEKMVMLTEQQDDEFLSPPEILEERLGSVDYDVWACLRCEFVDKFRHGAFFTRYSKCPLCRYRTKSQITETLIAATTSHGGSVRVRERCANCSYRHSYTYATPRKTEIKSSGSSSGGGFGRSSSGGGGFSGGGRSGGTSSGRGASGSW